MDTNTVGNAARLRAAPGSRGFWPWLLQRVSGLFLAYFVIVHVVMLHFLREGEIDASGVVERLRESTTMKAFYAVFVVLVVFHAFNGLRGIALDYVYSASGTRAARVAVWVLGLATVIYGFVVLHALTGLR
jgi:succinate dehydrogenase / fumarate reductase membrane anchor subunit